MLITFDGTTYNTDNPLELLALENAIERCTDRLVLQQTLTPLRLQTLSSDGWNIRDRLERRFSELGPSQVQLSQGFVFRDDRPKCSVSECKRPLELSQYSTGTHWFCDSTYAQFICGTCAMLQSSRIRECSKTDCTRRYWAVSSFDTCADCYVVDRYLALANDTTVTLPQVITTPDHHAGALGEQLYREYVAHTTGLEFVTVSSNNGIDLVFITRGNEEYDALKRCMPEAPREPQQEHRFTFRTREKKEVERGTIVHFFEVKVNEAQCSPAQRNAQAFVESRLKRALNGEYGPEARDGAREVERALQRAQDVELHLIRVILPRTGTPEYERGDPVVAIHCPWGEPETLKGAPLQLVEHCNTLSYMDSSWIGDVGEGLAKQFLGSLGFDIRGAVQNDTGNGVDLAAKLLCTPTSPCWAFFEVKASTVMFQTTLSHEEQEQWMFVADRCSKALLTIDRYSGLGRSLGSGLSVHPTTWNVNELWWDLQRTEDWTLRALYFQVAVKLPGPGQLGQAQARLRMWPSPRSQGTNALVRDPIPHPLVVSYGESPPPSTSTPSKLVVQTLAPHPSGGRYDNLHSCFFMNCGCTAFEPKKLGSMKCGSCGHPHGG